MVESRPQLGSDLGWSVVLFLAQSRKRQFLNEKEGTMSAKKKEQELHGGISTGGGHIDTGGGAVTAGDVTVEEGGQFAGRDIITSDYEPPPEDEISREDLVELLLHLSAQIEQLEGLEEWKRTELKGNLKTAEAMARAEEPPKEQLVDKLTATQKVLEAAKKVGTAALSLTPLLAKAVEWARTLF